MQKYTEIEKQYNVPDPWGFKNNSEDQRRKEKFIETISIFAPNGQFRKALDIGAGEAWITQDLPAEEKHGFELSHQAVSRWPEHVKNVPDPRGGYDLVTAMGILYSHYNYKLFFELMRDQAQPGGIIATCNIKGWEREEMEKTTFHRTFLGAEQIHSIEFPYREYIQKLRIFRKK